MARIVTDFYPDFVRIVLFIPAVELLGIQGRVFIKTGESWTERPGDVHSVVNAGTDTARLAVSILTPKGAEVTIMVK